MDVYYHVTMADLGPSYWAAPTFPHLTMSIWQNAFSNKELLFHALLFVFRSWQSVLSLPSDPPFHFLSFCTLLMFVSAFAVACRRFRVPFIPLFVIGVMVVSPSFTDRLLMIRPHVLAVTLMILACLSLNSVRSYRDLWRPLLWGFVFAWSYSNPHFLLLPSFGFALSRFRSRRLLSSLLPASVLLGIIMGYTIHPQFPNTFLIWKIQCIDVVREILSNASAARLGEEMAAPRLQWYWHNAALVCVWGANVILGALLIRLRPRKAIQDDTLAILLTGLASTAAVFFSLRAIEYACPFMVLALALLCRDLRSDDRIGPRQFHSLIGVMAVLFLCQAAAVTQAFLRPDPNERIPMTCYAHWARRHLPPGTLVANLLWGDFPMLFYSAPEYRYLTGLDPMFAVAYAPERAEQLELFRQGYLKLSPGSLRELTGTRFCFVSKYGRELAKDMHRDGFVVVYQGIDGWVFDLKLSCP